MNPVPAYEGGELGRLEDADSGTPQSITMAAGPCARSRAGRTLWPPWPPLSSAHDHVELPLPGVQKDELNRQSLKHSDAAPCVSLGKATLPSEKTTSCFSSSEYGEFEPGALTLTGSLWGREPCPHVQTPVWYWARWDDRSGGTSPFRTLQSHSRTHQPERRGQTCLYDPPGWALREEQEPWEGRIHVHTLRF